MKKLLIGILLLMLIVSCADKPETVVSKFIDNVKEKKIETDLGSYGIRKSTKVQIVDETLIPEDFIKIKTEKTLDKIGIANYIKNYGKLAGAKTIENYSLQIR